MNSHMLRAAFFDFDGTIFQTEAFHQAVVRQVFEEYTGEKVDEDEMRAYIGLAYADRLMHMLAMRGVDDDALLERLAQKASSLFQKEFAEKQRLVAGLPEFLITLSAQHILACVVSAAKRKRIEQDLTKANLRQFFQEIVSREDVSVQKPHPEPYTVALERCGIPASSVVAFEDSPAGIESATLAGIPVIALLTTFPAQDLLKARKTIRDFRGVSIEEVVAAMEQN